MTGPPVPVPAATGHELTTRSRYDPTFWEPVLIGRATRSIGESPDVRTGTLETSETWARMTTCSGAGVATGGSIFVLASAGAGLAAGPKGLADGSALASAPLMSPADDGWYAECGLTTSAEAARARAQQNPATPA